MGFLFALDTKTNEIIVSDSPKGGNKINLIERIGFKENEILFNAVVTLTSITNATELDITLFKSMDKICQLIYTKHKEKI